jgi:hypothetical protein
VATRFSAPRGSPAALRDDAPALALRCIAMAQLGDLVRAKAFVRSAARAFGRRLAPCLLRGGCDRTN